MMTNRVHSTHSNATLTITVCGRWCYTDQRSEEETRILLLSGDSAIHHIDIQEEGLEYWDSSLLVFLVQIVRTALQRKITLTTNLNEGLKRLIKLAFEVKRQEGSERTREVQGFFEGVGEKVLGLFPKLADFFEFFLCL